MTKREKVLQLLEKLQRLADASRNNSPEEAEAAAARMQKLMTEHQISQLEIGDEEAEDIDPIIHRTVMEELGMKKKMVGWRTVLCNGLCQANGCQMVQQSSMRMHKTSIKGKVHLFGKSSSLQTVLYMYQYLAAEVERLANLMAKQHFLPGDPRRKRWGNSFRYGCASGLYNRLVATRAKVVQEQCSDETKALIRRDDLAVEKAVEDGIGKVRKGQARQVSDWQGYDQGRKAAKNVHLGNQDRALTGSRKLLGD
jgi:hypothetical protein